MDIWITLVLNGIGQEHEIANLTVEEGFPDNSLEVVDEAEGEEPFHRVKMIHDIRDLPEGFSFTSRGLCKVKSLTSFSIVEDWKFIEFCFRDVR